MRAEKGFVKINEVDTGLSKIVTNVLQCYAAIKVTACEDKCRQSQLLFHPPAHFLVSSFCSVFQAPCCRHFEPVALNGCCAPDGKLWHMLHLECDCTPRKPAVLDLSRAGWNQDLDRAVAVIRVHGSKEVCNKPESLNLNAVYIYTCTTTAVYLFLQERCNFPWQWGLMSSRINY